jgi:hypothetical protein
MMHLHAYMSIIEACTIMYYNVNTIYIMQVSTSKLSDQHGYMAGFHCDQSLCDQGMNFA